MLKVFTVRGQKIIAGIFFLGRRAYVNILTAMPEQQLKCDKCNNSFSIFVEMKNAVCPKCGHTIPLSPLLDEEPDQSEGKPTFLPSPKLGRIALTKRPPKTTPFAFKPPPSPAKAIKTPSTTTGKAKDLPDLPSLTRLPQNVYVSPSRTMMGLGAKELAALQATPPPELQAAATSAPDVSPMPPPKSSALPPMPPPQPATKSDVFTIGKSKKVQPGSAKIALEAKSPSKELNIPAAEIEEDLETRRADLAQVILGEDNLEEQTAQHDFSVPNIALSEIENLPEEEFAAKDNKTTTTSSRPYRELELDLGSTGSTNAAEGAAEGVAEGVAPTDEDEDFESPGETRIKDFSSQLLKESETDLGGLHSSRASSLVLPETGIHVLIPDRPVEEGRVSSERKIDEKESLKKPAKAKEKSPPRGVRKGRIADGRGVAIREDVRSREKSIRLLILIGGALLIIVSGLLGYFFLFSKS